LPGPRDAPRAPDRSDRMPPEGEAHPDHQARSPVRESVRAPVGQADRHDAQARDDRTPQADRTQADRTQADRTQADRTQADRTQADRRLSAADERRMRVLEAFPPGHPSSPYLADGSRRPPVPSLRSLELPLPDERDEAVGGQSRESERAKRGTADNGSTADNTVGRQRELQNSDTPRPPESGHRNYWTEVPRFARVWADHERQWPKDKQPTARVDRSQDPPGSWRGDSNLFLSPENHARTKDAITRIRSTEPRVTVDLQNVVQESTCSAELVGLEFRNKGEDRLKEKVAESLQRRPDAVPEEAMRSISDAIRYTVRFSRDDYADGYRDIGQRLEAAGYVMFYGRNSWNDPQYKGINTRWVTPDGHGFEVQFHTPESYHAKQEVTHDAYERIRNPLTTDDERGELKEFQREVSSWIPVPKGAEEIPDYRKERF
jgi:hypothetical protein